jgi:hypothetical protein
VSARGFRDDPSAPTPAHLRTVTQRHRDAAAAAQVAQRDYHRLAAALPVDGPTREALTTAVAAWVLAEADRVWWHAQLHAGGRPGDRPPLIGP